MVTTNSRIRMLDSKPGKASFRNEILEGLAKPQKMTPCKYFYDEKGSSLFESICRLDEYYIPRTELSIMERDIQEIVGLLGPDVTLIEYGCGNCAKTEILLDNMINLAAYVPIDISREQLENVSGEIASNHNGLEVLPVCADYTALVDLPRAKRSGGRTAVYFPGSSFGNFHPRESKHFLDQVGRVCGLGGALLIGLDLKKDPGVLHRAYNDAEGITAKFNLNILERINRELGGDFVMDQFKHYAFYNPKKGRVEMHLLSLRDQTARVDSTAVKFSDGESIWTESSYKYSAADFARLVAVSGFRVERIWTDAQGWFSVQYLVKMA